ncbi:MAG: ParB/RepB/Spo0J family partition protein [Chloroflexaceae bacterium]|nr:ParB/RepB/Spo0J family partition protein [Chloroflexaceae bacterium]
MDVIEPRTNSELTVAAAPQDNDNPETKHLPLTQLVPRTAQPRRYFDPEKLQGLVRSIQSQGILEALLVRPAGSDQYEIVFGERRYRAAQLAGLTTVPCKIRPLSDAEALELSLIENLQREDINPIEETEGILQLLANKLQKNSEQVIQLLHRMQNEAKGKITQNVLGNADADAVDALFRTVGRVSWQSFVNARLPLLKLPEDILEVLRQGKIEYTKAKAIAKIDDPDGRQTLIEDAIAENLSLKQIQERVKAMLAGEETPDTPQTRIDTISRRLRSAKLWETNPQKWQQAQTLLQQLEELLGDRGEK